jgi:hypothetical protein
MSDVLLRARASRAAGAAWWPWTDVSLDLGAARCTP